MNGDEMMDAYHEFVYRSMRSQKGWVYRGGPNKHLTMAQQRELADLRAAVHIYLLEHPAPPGPPNPEMPF